ncbi:MAG: ATP-dependent DNA helicase RecG [Oscillospiraceae bacterium]|jgi:ATP-dependent DNA helicase RecG|nr:ATP-dependent DNA helicase RecG [Oscillospiraceae bacterium]
MRDINELSVNSIKGVGDRRAGLLAKLGVTTVGTLLRFYPYDYENWSEGECLSDVQLGEVVIIKAVMVTAMYDRYIRRGMTIYTGNACDDEGTVFKITLFNNPYGAKLLSEGESYLFKGKITQSFNSFEMSSPIFQKEDEARRLLPRYRQTQGLTSRVISNTIEEALKLADIAGVAEPLPPALREKRRLCTASYALHQIHNPDDEHALETAKKRLVFEELLILQIGLTLLKQRTKTKTSVKVARSYVEEFWSLLPFIPTAAQKRAAEEAMSGIMSQEYPMSRLLQGDVGSGKTAVAAALCYCMAKNGVQSALMAPTEILAEQHYRSLSELLTPAGISVTLLTGSTTPANKRKIRESLREGACSVAVGTHALISEGVEFSSLGLVITDEQHRFGVSQRAALINKGDNPHMLVMSATPIPRTLALIVYSDLDVSVLDEMPKGRQKVDTYRIDSPKRTRAYNFIKKHLDEGRQAYIVCPLVEEDEESEAGLMSADALYSHLSEREFKGYSVGLLHGKMKAAEKESVMRRFSQGEVQLLVATTVIEVGVDVPNSVIMMIENVERFGLSQLHQLRGRVGRGAHKSYCILVSDARGEGTRERLGIMTKTNDGFEISRKDLELRGPGDFFGSRQHGLPGLKLADISADMQVLIEAQDSAREILRADFNLELPENSGLKSAVDKLFDNNDTFRSY